MSASSFFSFFQPRSRKPSARPPATTRLEVEALEGRLVPTCNVISGYVYHDVNNNGLFDQGETPIAGSTLYLKNSSGVTVATATTDAQGKYEFTHDASIPQTPLTTPPQTITYAQDFTNYSKQGQVQQFNPALGELKSVTIRLQGSVTSEIKVENTSPNSPSTITGTISGDLSLSGPGFPPVTLHLSENAGSFTAAAFDGLMNHTGASGFTFDAQTANGFQQITLTDPAQIQAFIGGGQVTLTHSAQATSTATGGGNLNVWVISKAAGQVEVTYEYVPRNCLADGQYTIVQDPQPAGYPFDGRESKGGVVLGNLPGQDQITVTLQGQDLTNNNFGELKPAQVSGYVYHDADNDGVFDQGEAPIPGVTITLRDANNVATTAVTDATGRYQFLNLRPGVYSITEGTPPAEFLDGIDTVGSEGGALANDHFSNVNLKSGAQGINYNFGEVVARADLAVVKTASASSVLVGSELTYTLVISNLGTHTAEQVVVTDTLPPDATYVSAFGPGWQISHSGGAAGGTLTATIGSLAAGASSTIQVTIKAPIVVGDLVNTVTVTSSTPDPNPGNNTSTVTTTVYNVPGDTFPKTITPLVTTFAQIPIMSKRFLLGSTAGTAAGAQIRGLGTYVDGLFRTLLGRPADSASLTTYIQLLNSGQLTRAQLVAALWNSDGHRQLQAAEFYKVFLRRDSTASERAWVVSLLKGGTSETEIAVLFLKSTEYQASHPTPSLMVGGMYQDLLGRTPDLSTRLQLAQAMGATTVESFSRSLLLSVEGLGRIVDDGFRATLRRPATPAEIQHWVGQIQAGSITPAGLVQHLLTTDEFFNLAVRSAR